MVSEFQYPSTFFRWKKNLNQVQMQMFWNIPFSGQISSKFILNVDGNLRGNPDSGVEGLAQLALVITVMRGS